MPDLKSRLHGGVQDKKKKGAERLKNVLKHIKGAGVITEGELSKETGIEQKKLKKYVEYLKERGLVKVKKRLFKDAELSVPGGSKIHKKKKEKNPPKEPETPKDQGEEPEDAGSGQDPKDSDKKEPEKTQDTLEHSPEKVSESHPKQSEPVSEKVPVEDSDVSREASTESEAASSSAKESASETQETKKEPESPKSDGVRLPTPDDGMVSEEQDSGQSSETAADPEDSGKSSKDMISGGQKVSPETHEEFMNVCRSLSTDFMGAMRLHGEIEDRLYTAGLLIEEGDIVAASFEDMEGASLVYGDQAMDEIQSKFVGTKGDLEIYEMSRDGLSESLRNNIDYCLTKSVKLSKLKIKIKSRLRAEGKGRGSMLSGLKGLFGSGGDSTKDERKQILKEMQKGKIESTSGFNLVDFARNLKVDPLKAARFEELRQKKTPVCEISEGVDSRKDERKRQLQMEKSRTLGLKGLAGGSGQERDDRLRMLRQEDASPEADAKKEDEEKPVQRVKEGKKVKTSIDRLYQLVEKEQRIKINDALAAKLKVSKTQVEAWAMILEEHNLLELRYPTIGEPEIVSKKTHNKKEDKAVEDGS